VTISEQARTVKQLAALVQPHTQADANQMPASQGEQAQQLLEAAKGHRLSQ
jgi:hypothetical protein